ncbi:GAP family protein [Paeniglutamicibacter kerguelensis]|uniref:GAP family protein n=1 Tax=Paeniglutamicibacter kerguelensis TaxID=254788 RepID=A0ABS4XI47_9MICC|nr:GAP family protein [Paeniglutamicibacter kerguelensis]MBP2388105.1 hypothetical protein [Paeniglutamicibacter kerguelensis]
MIMILQAIGHLLPLAVAMAISSVPITAALLILLSPNPGRSPIAYLSGWILGIIVVVVLFALGAATLPAHVDLQPVFLVGIFLIAIGLTMEAFALVLWRRSDRTAASELPKWLRAVGAVRPWQAFGFGFALNLRPKSLLIGVAAGVVLTAHPLTVADATIAVAVYTALSASTVGIPVVFAFVSPERAEPHLVLVHDWIIANNRVITILVMVLIGFVIIGTGMTML